MSRQGKCNSSNSAMSGCTSILIPIIVIFMMIIKWIQENPTLAVIVLLGIISLILFAVSIFKTPSKKKYQQYNTNYRQMDAAIVFGVAFAILLVLYCFGIIH